MTPQDSSLKGEAAMTRRNGIWAAAFAATVALAGVAEAQQQQPVLSPRDTTKATIAGATIIVDYGRPSKRGRQVVGNLIPYDKVRRTGANKATHLLTDKGLMFGNVMVPAGTYTLYTFASETGNWKLAINKQTGQWGTEYKPEEDLARIDLKVATLPQSVEQFVIKIEPTRGGGILQLQGDTGSASAAFMVH